MCKSVVYYMGICYSCIKAKFHYASWFETGSKLAGSWSPTSFEPDSVMEFGFNDVFTRRRNCSFAEYWKHFVARLNGVHAFGYNSAGRERTCMKFGRLRAYCLQLGLGRFWTRSAQKRQQESAPKFCFFCQVNNSRLYRFSVSQISQNLHTKRGSKRW